MRFLRLTRSRLIFSLFVICVIFWLMLYWIFSNIYSRQRHFRLRSKSGVEDLLPASAEDVDFYSTLILENLARINTADDQRKFDAGYQSHAFNQMLSDKLSFTRPLPDARFEKCRDKTYSNDLPSTSVVICFYNEAMSTLLRTVHTVLARSPAHLIHEIILVDDYSDFEYLKTDLDDYVRSHLPKVKIYHSPERMGLIRARILGASHASGQVLLFLDSHCEVNTGWLEPLLEAVHADQHTVAVPLIDIIDADTFFYEQSGMVKGGFNWGMHYQWENLPAHVSKDIFEKAEPYRSPTMAGGLFAMDRLYFHELGQYDSGMDVWGGENLELSFRVWQCGGSLMIVPCSRVGHIFRKRRPYGAPVQDSFTKNTLRLVHVWLDEYKKYYFHINPRAEDMEFGNITSRVKLRTDLNCKSFHWYLENVYPEQLSKLPDLSQSLYPNARDKPLAAVNVPVRARGLLKHMGSGLCLQSEKTVLDKRALLQLAVCNPTGHDQLWYETEQKDFRLANMLCLDVNEDEAPFGRLMKCKGSNSQTWVWSNQNADNSQLLKYGTSKCLVATGVDPGSLIKTVTCSDSPLMRFSLVRI